jgi:hypothetical protein
MRRVTLKDAFRGLLEAKPRPTVEDIRDILLRRPSLRSYFASLLGGCEMFTPDVLLSLLSCMESPVLRNVRPAVISALFAHTDCMPQHLRYLLDQDDGEVLLARVVRAVIAHKACTKGDLFQLLAGFQHHEQVLTLLVEAIIAHPDCTTDDLFRLFNENEEGPDVSIRLIEAILTRLNLSIDDLEFIAESAHRLERDDLAGEAIARLVVHAAATPDSLEDAYRLARDVGSDQLCARAVEAVIAHDACTVNNLFGYLQSVEEDGSLFVRILHAIVSHRGATPDDLRSVAEQAYDRRLHDACLHAVAHLIDHPRTSTECLLELLPALQGHDAAREALIVALVGNDACTVDDLRETVDHAVDLGNQELLMRAIAALIEHPGCTMEDVRKCAFDIECANVESLQTEGQDLRAQEERLRVLLKLS